MAIDTVSKRVSSIKKTLPLPDGTIDAGDRAHITWNYSGITIANNMFAPVWTLIAVARKFVFTANQRGI